MSLPVWSEKFRIRLTDMNARGTLKIRALLEYFQEAAMSHATEIRVNYHHLTEYKLFWVLSQIYLKVDRLPEHRQELELRTAPTGRNRFFIMRDFELLDSEGSSLCQGKSGWLLIDAEKSSIVRQHEVIERIVPFFKEPFIQYTFNKIQLPNRYETEKQFEVGYGDLDVNRHVNNIHFIEWMLESLPESILSRGGLKSLEVNFLSEAFYKDIILARSVSQKENPAAYYHSLIRRQDKRELFRAVSMWEV